MGTSAVIGENFDYFRSNPAILAWVMCETRLLQVPSTSTSRLVRYFHFFPQLFSLQASFPTFVFPHVQQPQPNWFVTLQTGPSTELVQANSCQRPSIPSCAPTWSTPSPSWTMATRSPDRTRPVRLGCTHHSWSWRTGEKDSFGGSAEQFTVTGPLVLHTHTYGHTHHTIKLHVYFLICWYWEFLSGNVSSSVQYRDHFHGKRCDLNELNWCSSCLSKQEPSAEVAAVGQRWWTSVSSFKWNCATCWSGPMPKFYFFLYNNNNYKNNNIVLQKLLIAKTLTFAGSPPWCPLQATVRPSSNQLLGSCGLTDLMGWILTGSTMDLVLQRMSRASLCCVKYKKSKLPSRFSHNVVTPVSRCGDETNRSPVQFWNLSVFFF